MPDIVFAMASQPVLQRKCACGGRSCLACSSRDRIQRRALGSAHRAPIPPIVDEVLGSPAPALPSSLRTRSEAIFGFDFSQVRIHADERAAESARQVNALAYTVGRDVVFAAGQYRPESREGQRLLSHELAHVVQQQGDLHAPLRPGAISAPVDAAERQADRAADAAVRGVPIGPLAAAPAQVARFDIPLWSCPRRVAQQALRQAQASGLPGLHNGTADAYRHCYWSCEMVKQCSWLSAYTAGTGHELTDWTPVESDMDLNNNAAGRDCGGQSGSCDQCCRDKLNAGRLTVMETDTPGSGYYHRDMGYHGIRDTPDPNEPRRY